MCPRSAVAARRRPAPLLLAALALRRVAAEGASSSVETVAAGGVSSSVETVTAVGVSSSVDVEVLFVRHGHACHNALKKQGGRKGQMMQTLFMDPPLTDCGRFNAKKSGEALWKVLEKDDRAPHFVFSSSLLRAVESALVMFPDMDTVYPLPFVGERGMGVCNYPLLLGRQKNAFREALDAGKVNLTFVEPEGPDSFELDGRKWAVEDARKLVDYELVRAFLGEKVVPKLVSWMRGKGQLDDEHPVIRLVIVSHSNFLKEEIPANFKCRRTNEKGGKFKVDNGGAIWVSYRYSEREKSARLVEVPLKGDCEAHMTEPSNTWKEDYLCQADYQRCDAFASKGNFPFSLSTFINKNETGDECCVQEPTALKDGAPRSHTLFSDAGAGKGAFAHLVLKNWFEESYFGKLLAVGLMLLVGGLVVLVVKLLSRLVYPDADPSPESH